MLLTVYHTLSGVSTIFESFLRFCEVLTRSGEVSCAAPENSLALFNDASRKKVLDSHIQAQYNIYMKLRNIRKKMTAEYMLILVNLVALSALLILSIASNSS